MFGIFVGSILEVEISNGGIFFAKDMETFFIWEITMVYICFISVLDSL